ncbi:MAG: aminoacyl-tRNA hydrolase [Thermodesulfovibrionales bacterium]
MWLLVGLGNPGARYAKTRHNVGFMAIDRLAAALGLEFAEKSEYLIAKGSIGDEQVVLLEPLTFMNRSGSAVKKVSDKFGIPPERILVVYDDLDIENGRIKIRKKGSSGGHRGVESIIQSIGSREFPRIRIGIGRDPFVPAEQYVLAKFTKDQQPSVREAVERTAEIIPVIIGNGIDTAMNRFN